MKCAICGCIDTPMISDATALELFRRYLGVKDNWIIKNKQAYEHDEATGVDILIDDPKSVDILFVCKAIEKKLRLENTPYDKVLTVHNRDIYYLREDDPEYESTFQLPLEALDYDIGYLSNWLYDIFPSANMDLEVCGGKIYEVTEYHLDMPIGHRLLENADWDEYKLSACAFDVLHGCYEHYYEDGCEDKPIDLTELI